MIEEAEPDCPYCEAPLVRDGEGEDPTWNGLEEVRAGWECLKCRRRLTLVYRLVLVEEA